MTDAQKRASTKWAKKHAYPVYLKLNKNTDKDVIAKLESVENKQGYIKGLILADIEKIENI